MRLGREVRHRRHHATGVAQSPDEIADNDDLGETIDDALGLKSDDELPF